MREYCQDCCDKGFSQENVIFGVVKERDRYKKSLKHIIEHQELSAGSMLNYSVSYRIAKEELEDKGGEG